MEHRITRGSSGRLAPTLKARTVRPTRLGKCRFTEMDQTCYLCGLPIDAAPATGDHVVPKLLIARKQPKVKGFDYGGVLPAHPECNNHFGPEGYCAKALELMAILHDTSCWSADPSIEVLTIKSECLKTFTRRDLEFFKFIDMRGRDSSEISSPSFFSDKTKTNPTQNALFIALAVLTKSAGALLISRHLRGLPPRWRVLAIPYSGATEADDFDIDALIGGTKPFDIGVKVWIHPSEEGNWSVIYRAHNLLVFFLFTFTESGAEWGVMVERFTGRGLSFSGNRLTELIDYTWQKV